MSPQVVVELFHDLCDNYKNDRQGPYTEEWPPNQPSSIVNLALIHYRNMRTQQELIEISKRSKEGASCIDKLAASHSNVTKDIKELFMSDAATESTPPRRILIEGAPGIGKTVLAKEIAYQWAKGEILKEYKLVFLLYLRDPKVHEVHSIKEILELFTCENTPKLFTYIKKCRGENVAFVLDGFDEYPVALQRESFIADLIKCENDGKLFLNSAVIVTSRPTATLFLHSIVDRRIEVLGFPKEERDKYVLMSLRDSPDKAQELDKYLKQHPIINSVCYIPLHLAILMYLFKQDSLPETLTEMNDSFIINTIYRYLEKKGLRPLGVVKKLTDLPNRIVEFVSKLAKLAFKGLENNQLVFSLDEIKVNCPEVDDINGFGLLQAVQHYPKKGAGRTTSVNFLHFTMQEYLAALRVSTLHYWSQLSLMERTFWNGQFNFMWMMYVGIVGVNSEAFVSFIALSDGHAMSDDIPVYNFPSSDNYSIKDNICNDKLKCLHLFQCYMEATSTEEMPKEISSIFTNNEIALNGVTLLPHHISSLIFFMSASSMQWQILKLGNCNLGDVGINNLLEHIMKSHQNLSRLEYVDLSGNSSSPWCVYCAIIRHCCVNSLTLCGDKGMKEYVKEITGSLQVNTTLKSLTLFRIGRIGVESFESILQNGANTTLREVNFSLGSNAKGTKILSTNLKSNPHSNERVINVNILSDDDFEYSPETITLSNTVINDDVVYLLSLGLRNNTTVKKLDLPYRDISFIGMTRLSECVKHPIPLEYVDLSGNEASPWGVYCVIIRYCCVGNLTLYGNKGMEEYFKEITYSLRKNRTLHSLTLCASKGSLKSYKEMVIKASNTKRPFNILVVGGKQYFKTLNNGDGKVTSHSDDRVVNVKILYATDYCLPETISFPHVDINDDMVCLITFGLCNNTTVKKLDLSHSNISVKGITRLSECIKHPTALEYVDLSGNKASPWGVYCAIIRYCCVNSLTLCGDEGIEKYVNIIKDSLQTNTMLQSLTLCKIRKVGVHSIKSMVVDNQTLKELSLSWEPDAKGTKIFSRKFKPAPCSANNVININILYHSDRVLHHGLSVIDDAMHLISFGLRVTVKELDFSVDMDGSMCVEHAMSLRQIWKTSSPWSVYCPIIKHCCVSSLILYGDKGMKEYIKEVTDTLQANSTLQSLTLCKIGRTGVESIEIILGNCTYTTLKELNLSWGSNAKGTKILSTNLKPIPHNNDRVINVNILCDDDCEYLPEIVTLSNKVINDDVAYLLSLGLCNNTIVQKLDLPYGNISIDGMNRLSECIKHPIPLQYVDLSGNEASPWGVYCAVIRYCCVNSLTLCGDEEMNKYVKRATCSVQANATLQSLTLCKIGRTGVESIESILGNGTNLKELNLSWGSNAKGTKILSANLKLTPCVERVINVNILCDDNYEYCPNTVSFPNTVINDDTAYLLSVGLYNNTILKKLNLPNGYISFNGMSRLSECIKHPMPLEYVDLSENMVSPWGVYCAIIRYCCINSLTLFGDGGMNKYVKKTTDSLQANATLQSLTLCKIGRIGVESIEIILGNGTNLKELNLSWGSNAKGTKILSTNLTPTPNIERVINVNILCDNIYEYLPETITLSDTVINDDVVYLLSLCLYNNTTIKKLNLPNGYISTDGINRLSQCVKHASSLESIDLSKNEASPWKVYCAIIECCFVNALTFHGDEEMEKYTREIEHSLQKNTTLQSLTLCKIGRVGLQLIKHVLGKNTTVKELNLSWKSEGTKIIHRKVTCNELNNNSLGSDNHEGMVDVNILYDGDHECSSEAINMFNKDINDDAVYLITFGLYNSASVQILDLSCNNITDDGAVAISDCFKSNYSLHTLILSRNRVSYKGAMNIAEMIQINKVIRKLDMSCNNICDNGAVAISEALKANNTLQELNLSDNCITSEGAKKIAEALCTNKGLRKLDISCNSVCYDGISHISNSLKNNNTLLELYLSKVVISEDESERLLWKIAICSRKC